MSMEKFVNLPYILGQKMCSIVFFTKRREIQTFNVKISCCLDLIAFEVPTDPLSFELFVPIERDEIGR